MRPNRMRIAVASVLLLLPAGIGAVAAHASPACERLVHTYITVPVRNRVSKATAMAWARWGEGHPGWKPKAHATRPRYRMTREEQMARLDQACQVQRARDSDNPLLSSEELNPQTIASMSDPLSIALPAFSLPRAEPGASGGAPAGSTPGPFDPSGPPLTASVDADSEPEIGASGVSGAPELSGAVPGAATSFGGGFPGVFSGGSGGAAPSASGVSEQQLPVTVTPEPSSLALLALGLTLLAFALPWISRAGREAAPCGVL